MSDAAAPGARVLRLWERLHHRPGGRSLFAALLGRMVPYTGSMGARIEELSPGRAVASLRDRRAVRNHLGSVHAVALVNLGEVVTGLAVLTALPPGVRGIVTRLSAEYLRKARGSLTASARADQLGLERVAEPREVQVVAEIRDASEQLVARVTAYWRVGS
jgi:acyl-coenzyme A thioesterase PaaI-like protein